MGEIAADTCILSMNPLKEQSAAIGRSAFLKGVSKWRLVWDYFLVGCKEKDPELYARLVAARKQRFASAAAIALCCWCHASAIAGDDEMLRPGRVVRVSRTAHSLRINRSQSFKLAA